MSKLTVKLELTVTYEEEDGNEPNEKHCHSLLENLVQRSVENGYLSGDSNLIVDDYRTNVKTCGHDC